MVVVSSLRPFLHYIAPNDESIHYVGLPFYYKKHWVAVVNWGRIGPSIGTGSHCKMKRGVAQHFAELYPQACLRFVEPSLYIYNSRLGSFVSYFVFRILPGQIPEISKFDPHLSFIKGPDLSGISYDRASRYELDDCPTKMILSCPL